MLNQAPTLHSDPQSSALIIPLPTHRSRRSLPIAAFIALSLNAAARAALPTLIDIGSSGGITPSDEVLLSASGVITCTADDPGFGIYGRRIPFIWSEATGLRPIVGLGGSYIHVWQLNKQGTFEAYSTLSGDTIAHEFVGSLTTGPVDFSPAGVSQLQVFNLSDQGQVVGSFADPNRNLATSGFIWDRSLGFRDLGTPANEFSYATGVSDGGVVVGSSGSPGQTGYCFIWDAVNGLQNISAGIATPYSGPVISRSGVVVAYGASETTGNRGFFIWDATRGGRFIEFPSGMFIMGPQLAGISDSGAIASASDMFGGTMAIDTTRDTITFLGQGNNQRPTGPGGHVISNDENGGFVWDLVNGKRQIGDVDNFCFPASVNSRGQVVGYTYPTTGGPGQAFLWDDVNGLQKLGTLGGDESFAWQITDTMIAGTSKMADGSTHVFYAKLDGGKPDLQITRFTITPDPKKTPASSKGKGKGSDKDCDDDDSKNAKTATVKVFVANKGSGSAVASSTKIVDGKKLLTTLATPAIPAGQSVTLTYSWDLKKVEEGKHTLTATADSAAQVTETSETNNTLTTSFTIKED